MFRFKTLGQKVALLSVVIIVVLCVLTSLGSGRIPYILSLTSQNNKFYMESLSKNSVAVYETMGEKGLEKFLQAHKKNENVDVVFVLPNNKTIATTTPPEHVKKKISQHKDDRWYPFFHKSRDYFIYLENSGNQRYTIAINPSNRELPLNLSSIPGALHVVLTLLIISATIYLLVTTLYSPLKLIIEAIRQLSHGDLTTRVSSKLTNKNDELASLGKDFDQMAETLESLINSKKQTFHNIAHELRSPLARIRMATTLLEKNVNDEGKSDLAVVEHESYEMEKLIDEVLSLAKLNSHTRSLTKQAFELNTVLEELVQSANYEINQERVSLKSPSPIQLFADRALVKRAIENVLRNALYYSGEVSQIKVYTCLKDKKVSICISDNGPGIAKEKIAIIFEPFIRDDNSSKERHQGYGLGLAITKKIVNLHHGEIHARNLKPHGLEVIIDFPMI